MPLSAGESVATDKKENQKLVLVYQIGSLGDTIVSIPAYRAVRRHFGPGARIYVLHNAPPNGRASPHQVLDGSGLIDGAVTFQQRGGRSAWKTQVEVWRKLRCIKPDAIAYIAPGERLPRQVKRDRLFFKLCGVSNLLGFHACDQALFQQKDAAGHPALIPQEAIMRVERLEEDGIAKDHAADFAMPLLNVLQHERGEALAWLAAHGGAGQTFAAICPGANQPANFWPLDRFEEIGRRLPMLGGILPLVIGGPAEREMGSRLIAAWGRGINAAGEFSVMGSAALLGECRFLVGLDTGTTHLAASLGIPCVVVSGERQSPGQWAPMGKGHQVLRHSVPCAGCGQSVCPVLGHPCMTGLTVEQVWAAIVKVNGRS